MNIALTGVTGLVGGAILRQLLAQGHSVLALARDTKHPSLPKGSKQLSIASMALENIPGSVAGTMAEFAPEVMIHAGWIGTENTNRNQPEFVSLNLQSCLRLFQMAQEAGCKRWIGFGSQAEYSPDIQAHIVETAPTFPENSYGIRKLAARHLLQNLCAAAGMGFSWLRLYTCYGKASRPSYIIPQLIETMRGGNMPALRTPNAMADYLHADDAADAVMAVLKQPRRNGVFNLSYGKGTTVGEIALLLAEYLHFAKMDELRRQLKESKTASTRRVADMTSFTRNFGWKPTIDIRTGLKRCL